MGMTGAETVQEGSTRPDWGLFVPARMPIQTDFDDELEEGDINLEDEDEFSFPQDDHTFPEPPGMGGTDADIDLPMPDIDELGGDNVLDVTDEGDEPEPDQKPAKKKMKKKDNTLLIAGAAAVGLLAFSGK